MVVVKGYVEILVVFIYNGVDFYVFIWFGDIVFLFVVEEGCLECVKIFV